MLCLFLFFKQKTAYEMRISDWSSDVCSSDLVTEKITIDLNVFDDEGNVVDGTTADLSHEQISDIIDHASQMILARRDDGNTSSLDAILDELEEALVSAGVIDDQMENAHRTRTRPAATERADRKSPRQNYRHSCATRMQPSARQKNTYHNHMFVIP